MAETCIVCLGDLVPHDEGTAAADPSLATIPHDGAGADGPRQGSGTIHPGASEPVKDDDLVAHLLPCGHDLHNECLKPWVERANSCPICRASFNMVELSARVGGPKLSEYAVQDKQQVAEIDPSMIIEDDYTFEDDGSYDACMVCDEFGDAARLMYCHSCEQLCHVFCAGLDRMPSRGPWYCHGCVENPGMLEAASRRRPAANSPAAWVNGRSRVPRHNRAPDEWVGVWQSVWDRLQFDIEFPFEDEEQSENHSDVLRRENHIWERRFALAQQVGAGTRFRAAADTVQSRRRGSNRSTTRPANRALHREPPRTPKDPESQEELRAWNQFEKAREQLAQMEAEPAPTAPSTTSSRRGRKRKSVDSSPAESEPREPKPERKLKRPRTRLHIDNGESSSAATRRATLTQNHATSASSPPAAQAGESTTPGFLQSLLQEVEVDRFAERDREIAAPQPRRVIVDRACSPQNSSPGLSPVYQKPLGMTTPPPLNLTRNKSPIDKDQHSPTYSPFSPADEDRIGRHKLVQRSAGLSSPPRSKDSSPTRPSLSYSTKAELQRMVTAVLKPFYLRKEVTKEEYTDINRDISRLLYDKVGEAGADALVDQTTREKWQLMASTEVEGSIQALRTSRAAALSPAAEDSASSST